MTRNLGGELCYTGSMPAQAAIESFDVNLESLFTTAFGLSMPDKFDPYREALVMEQATEWPEEYEDWDPARRAAIAQQLHDDPENAADLRYVRNHTGFCRHIVVTPEDIERLDS